MLLVRCSLLVLVAVGTCDTSLQLLQILFRHGDRSPLATFPTDPHSAYWISIGYGQLSNVGKSQEYELGQYFRNRYVEFLNDTYDRRQVKVRSTDVDRTLMSAECVLSGLYPPVDEHDQWNQNLTWQPIPIHTVPVNDDYLLGDAPCPVYDRNVSDVMNSSEVRKILADEAEFYNFLSKETGSTVQTFEQAASIYDTLLIDKINNMSLPKWIQNDTVFERLGVNAEYSFFYMVGCTDVELRLRTGWFLKELIGNMNRKIKGTEPDQQLYLYSAHDTNVVGLLAALGVYNRIPPPYGSTVFVELHRLQNGTDAVQISYRNTTTEPPHVLTMPNCSALCPFDRFVELTRHLVPTDDVRVECGAAADDHGENRKHRSPINLRSENRYSRLT